MKTREVAVTLVGLSPLLYNEMKQRVINFPEAKTRAEDWDAYEERVWKYKTVTMEMAKNKDDEILAIKGTWLKMGLIDSQRQNRFPIKPPNARKATDTMMTYFGAGIIFEDRYPILDKNQIPQKVSNCVKLAEMVRPQKNGGRILCFRPRIDTWMVHVTLHIIDEAIAEKDVISSMGYCGSYMGIGDWRPQNKGVYGRFIVNEGTTEFKLS